MIRNYINILLFKEASGLVQFLRYGTVSAFALLVDVGLLLGFVSLGFHYVLAATLAFLCGVVIVYFGSIYWVFPKRSVTDERKEMFTFFIIGLIGLLLTDGLLYVFVEWVDFSVILAKGSATIVVFLFNFITRKFLLFT